MTARADTRVALLRGVNVGGTRKVPMGELAALFSSLGFDDVVTYIQSGNVVFRGSGETQDISAAIARRISEVFGLDIAVVLRTAAELVAIAGGTPFAPADGDASKLHVVFLDRTPAAHDIAELDPRRSPPDEFHVRGREIYLHLPNGAGRSKLTIDYFERRLGVRGTARNWNTLTKLVELAQR